MLQTQSLTLGGTQLQLQRSQRRAGRSSCGTQAAQRQFRTIREDIDKKRLQKQGVITKTVGSPKPQPPTPAPAAQEDAGPNYVVAVAVALLVPLVAWLALGGGQ
ncbi:hypothetical protein COHA_007163 [Chlorella ohadii]|uniref:Uncharacterized protein n=1 Tax=Chlorella ohadii TaxID=2649997 RepID=A0AAD5DLA6_9CHLO|nr:hypothetical protein COHA_007163 [Chlorella ohadii]